MHRIAGGWWWCTRCQCNHQECSPCPKDPDYVPPDPEDIQRRLDILQRKTRVFPEFGAYQCRCAICGKFYDSDDKRSSYCGC